MLFGVPHLLAIEEGTVKVQNVGVPQPLEIACFLAEALLDGCVDAYAFPQHLNCNQRALPPPQKHLQDVSNNCLCSTQGTL